MLCYEFFGDPGVAQIQLSPIFLFKQKQKVAMLLYELFLFEQELKVAVLLHELIQLSPTCSQRYAVNQTAAGGTRIRRRLALIVFDRYRQNFEEI